MLVCTSRLKMCRPGTDFVVAAYICTLLPALLTSAQTVPAFVWGSGDYIENLPAQSGLQASYEATTTTHLAKRVLGYTCSAEETCLGTVLNQTAISPDSHSLVSLFVLGQLRRADLATHGVDSAWSPLKQAIEAAPSAMYLPNAKQTAASLSETLETQAGSLLQMGACSDSDKSAVEQLQAKLAREQGNVTGLLCEDGHTNNVTDLEKLLQEAGRHYIIIYVGQPDKTDERPVQRLLLSPAPAANDQKLCVGKCMVQVRLFEVLILLVTLLTALGAGMFMLHILDTPSRFETEKKDTTRSHD